MRLSTTLLALPPSLLIFISELAAQGQRPNQALEWPYNLPKHYKYYPEDELIVRREAIVQQHLQNHAPQGVRKMSLDEGEKFFLEYWTLGDTSKSNNTGDSAEELILAIGSDNASLPQLQPPIPVHALFELPQQPTSVPRLARFLNVGPRAIKRDYSCPSGTSNCASIGRPNSCCPAGETCQIVQGNALGDVGCCAAGQTCSGSVSQCQDGYTDCPNNPGGGCCIPGYQCDSVGCILASTATVTVQPTVSSQAPPPPTSSSSLPPVVTTSTTTVVVPGRSSSSSPTPPSSSSSSSSSPSSPSTSSSSSSSSSASSISSSSRPTSTSITAGTTVTTASVCSTGFRACPASLGGGCCPTDRACGSNNLCPPLSTTNTPGAPVRPTSGTTTSEEPTPSGAGCPTGFYVCSAFYQGGCCRVGRDCGKTSCPAIASSTLINSGSRTVVAPLSSGITANVQGPSGSCPSGWSSCAQNAGGGCCPTGFACGSSCTATATQAQISGQEVGKVAPNGTTRNRRITRDTLSLAAGLLILSTIALATVVV